MKAIHNATQWEADSNVTVFNTSKIQNESNSQLWFIIYICFTTVFNTSKIQNESNSQQGSLICDKNKTVFNTSKIQNESNSQHKCLNSI